MVGFESAFLAPHLNPFFPPLMRQVSSSQTWLLSVSGLPALTQINGEGCQGGVEHECCRDKRWPGLGKLCVAVIVEKQHAFMK